MKGFVGQRCLGLAKGLSSPSLCQGCLSVRCFRESGRKLFHSSAILYQVRPYLLADIGKWFVKPGDHASEFDAICEVQSDKASVEITSRYDGVIIAIHHAVDEMATVGKPLLDIDVEDKTSPVSETPPQGNSTEHRLPMEEKLVEAETTTARSTTEEETSTKPDAQHTALATPAVRRMLKEHHININQVAGTGKDGRVLKEDVLQYLSQRDSPAPTSVAHDTNEADEIARLSPTDSQMFKAKGSQHPTPRIFA